MLGNGEEKDTEVPDGWAGKGIAENWCNDCRCLDGMLMCTRMACGPEDAIAQAEDKDANRTNE